MNSVFIGAKKFVNGTFDTEPLYICGETFALHAAAGADIYDYKNCYIFPGFVDVHVHLREPGFSYKETIKSGTAAAAKGGYTAVCTMPNLDPAPDCREGLESQLDIIRRDACIKVYPYGTITRGEKGRVLSDMDALFRKVIAFSDDGKGIQAPETMREAMLKAKALGKLIVAHCEDETLISGGCIHDGQYARLHGLPGISGESEWRQVGRDLELVRETGCAYHVCHVSTKESVELIRCAKREGLDVTCETAPHYLVMSDMMLRDEGRYKMNPPIRGEEDRLALLQGVKDGTIDMIATDHAPHSAEEKSKGLRGSLMGVSGLEAAFPVLYTKLVLGGEISLEKLIELMSINPAKRFGIPCGIKHGNDADFCVIDLSEKFVIEGNDFLSLGKATPFEGMEVFGKIKYTSVKGETAWQSK